VSEDKMDKDTNKEDSSSNLIKGAVADILNEREVVLNIGSRDGVKKGMRFGILDNLEYEIKDPITGESLGNLPPRPKIRIEIVQMTERISIGRTYGTRRKNLGGLGGVGLGVSALLEMPRYVEEPITFRVGGGATYFKKISPEDSVVQIGDAVIQLTKE
jgi:hypothetical protein